MHIFIDSYKICLPILPCVAFLLSLSYSPCVGKIHLLLYLSRKTDYKEKKISYLVWPGVSDEAVGPSVHEATAGYPPLEL